MPGSIPLPAGRPITRPRCLLTATLGVLAFVAALAVTSRAQTSDRHSPLTIEQIMQEPERWIGDWPANLRWHENGTSVYFDWNPKGRFQSDSLFRVPRAGGTPLKVSPSHRRANPPFFTGWHHPARRYAENGTMKVYEADGDLYLYDREAETQVRLTDTATGEQDPRFGANDERIIFARDHDLFALDLRSGSLEQLTDLCAGSEPPEPDTTERERFLKNQQRALFETLAEENRERKAAEEASERDRKADDPPPTFHAEGKQIQQLRLDPTGRFVTFALQAESDQVEPTTVLDYLTLSGAAETRSARPKVGVPPEAFELYVQDLQRDTTYAVDLHQLPGAYDVPAYRKAQAVELDSTETRRTLFSHGPFWSHDEKYAVLVVRTDDNKDRWIVRLDPRDGDLTVLDRQHDEAWIGGPGIDGFGGAGAVGWMPGGDWFYFQSEASGYSHLYRVHVASGEKEQLTSGEFVVDVPRLTRDGSTWYFLANADSPHAWHVYRMPAAGGDIERITDRPSTDSPIHGEDFALSPDGERIAVLFSRTNRPPELYLQETSPEAEPKRITHSPTEEWLAYDWRRPEITRFEASDGTQVPVQVYRPDEPNGAGVWFVHGAGYLQDVTRHWSSFYFREHMFHNLLADLGYTVLSVAYRGSAGYGRDWRTAVYRHMGGRDLQDYVDGSGWLAETHEIPADRQFIYGGSYGGFMTLMALFEAPDRFAGGAALRSVTDWAHYNDPYTSNILNDPQTDSLAYARSSPIYHAEGLEDPLLLAHGLVDENVQVQDIFRLSQRLIELGKEDWELATYPAEGHGFEHPSSWADEYRRILELIRSTVAPDSQY